MATRATCTSGAACRCSCNSQRFRVRSPEERNLLFVSARQQTSRGEHDRYGKQCLREASCADPSSAHCTGGRIAVVADRMEADTTAQTTMGLFVGVGCLEAAYRERCSCRSDRAARRACRSLRKQGTHNQWAVHHQDGPAHAAGVLADCRFRTACADAVCPASFSYVPRRLGAGALKP